jgi:hypothetical protein
MHHQLCVLVEVDARPGLELVALIYRRRGKRRSLQVQVFGDPYDYNDHRVISADGLLVLWYHG